MSNNGFSVESHFSKQDPVVRKIYDRLLRRSAKFGSVIEEPKKTSIHLVNQTAFAGVATRKSAIVLTVKSDQARSSRRIHKSEQTSARRFHHEIKLTSRADVDPELLDWLRNAYDLSN